MAKKKSGFGLGKILSIVAIVLGLVAVCMLFVDAVKVPDTELLGNTVKGEGYSGLKVAFGYKEEDTAVFAFSFMGLLPVILVLAGMVLSGLNAFSKKGSKMLDYVAMIAFVVAGVLYFIMPSFVVCADTLLGKIAAEIDYVLAVGSIVAAICSILAGLAVLAKNLMKK